jgi:hypothetical protein
MKGESYVYTAFAKDIDLLKQGQIRLVSKARARKLRKKGVACWWSAELYSRVRTGLTTETTKD